MSINWEPLGYRVMVEFEPVKEVEGLIIKPQETVKSEQGAQVRATLVSIGPNAFDDYSSGARPEPGVAVLVAKYGGFEVPGKGNELLRVYNDEDIAAMGVSK